MIIYTICDKNYNQITKTPIKEQAIGFAISQAKETGKIYGVGKGAFRHIPQEWYGGNGFICKL